MMYVLGKLEIQRRNHVCTCIVKMVCKLVFVSSWFLLQTAIALYLIPSLNLEEGNSTVLLPMTQKPKILCSATVKPTYWPTIRHKCFSQGLLNSLIDTGNV